jgi:hypothetical protein
VSVPFAGVLPLSAFTETTHEDPLGPPIILADAIDPQTQEYVSLERGLDPVDAAVAFTVSVERDSGSAIQGVGHAFREIRYVAPDLAVRAEAAGREALRHLVSAGVVEILGVDVEAGRDGVETTIRYMNLPQRDERTMPVIQ